MQPCHHCLHSCTAVLAGTYASCQNLLAGPWMHVCTLVGIGPAQQPVIVDVQAVDNIRSTATPIASDTP